MADYKVSLKSPVNFPADRRIRAGVEVFKAGGYEGELTKEQLEAIEADEHLVVEEVKGSKPAPKKATK